MARRAHNARLVKIHRNYTVEEIAQVLGAHKQTVRNWLRDGLATIDERRPSIVLGSVLRKFLEDRRANGRTKCLPGQLYCFGCRLPKVPALNMADCIKVTEQTANLEGLCPDCGVFMYRCVSLARLDEVRGDLEIRFPRARPRLGENASSSVNCHLRQEGEGHENAQRRE